MMAVLSKPQIAFGVLVPLAVISLGYYLFGKSTKVEKTEKTSHVEDLIPEPFDTTPPSPLSPEDGKKKKKKKKKKGKNGKAEDANDSQAAVLNVKEAPADVVTKALELKSEGNSFYNEKKYLEAIEKYTEALSLNISDESEIAKFLSNRAACYTKLNQHQQVVADCTKALQHDPTFVRALQRRAYAYEALGELEKAALDFAKVGSIPGKDIDVQESVERILKQIGQLKAREKILEKRGNFPPKNIVKTYIESFEKDAVKVSAKSGLKEDLRISKSIEQSPKDASLYYERGMNRIRLGDYNFALEDFNKCVELDENHIEARIQQATLLHLSGLLDEACLAFDKILDKDPRHVNALIKKANLLIFKGMFPECEKLVKLAYELAPKDPICLLHRGQMLAQMGQTEEAIKSLYEVIQVDPRNCDAYNQLGMILSSLDGRQQEAFDAFENAIKWKENPADAYNNYGLILQACGKTDLALENFDKAIKADANCAMAYCNKGFVILNSQGKVDQAIQLYQKAVQVDPHCIEAYCNLALVYFQTSKCEKAIEYYDKAIDLSFMEADLAAIYGFRAAAELRLNLVSCEA